MNHPAIHVESLGKRYRIGGRARYRTMGDGLANALRPPARWFRADAASGSENEIRYTWALRNVSFDLQEGEVFGLIVRNCAGKMTLLKIPSPVTQPIEGSTEIRGRAGSPLEVGTGFHPEQLGCENIYQYGTILGMGKKEIERKFDDIIAKDNGFLDLDAHWHDDLPLREEVDLIFRRWTRPVLMIDDFQVPDDSGYQFDDYGQGKKLSLEYLDPVAHLGFTPFFPALPSSEEVGVKRGWVVLASDGCSIDQLRKVTQLREWRLPKDEH
jgi:energy-coupling factor transporter ATP-binding protein EcfA2